MALLLAMYQKMKLVREKNQLTLKLTQYTSKLDRVTKSIERTQKRYTSLFQQLESQAKMMQSNANMMFQQMAGIGTNCVSLNNYSGMNGFVYNVMAGMFKNNITGRKDAEGNALPDIELGSDLFKKMYAEYMQNGRFIPATDADGKQLSDQYKNGYSQEQVAAFMQAMQAGQMQQSQAQMWAQQSSTQYGNNVSIWLEAQKAQLEAEQDAALEPLNYEETMMELEKTQIETRLERIKQQEQSYSQLVSDEAKNSAPTFGLG